MLKAVPLVAEAGATTLNLVAAAAVTLTAVEPVTVV